MSDRDIQAWEERLKQQYLRGWDNYVRRRIDLSDVRTNEYFGIAGEFVYVEKVSSSSANATIRINRNTNDEISLELATTVKTIFTVFYVTNAAQAGEWIDIIIGINFEYYNKSAQAAQSVKAQPIVPLTHAVADTNVTPAAQICNTVLITADLNNIADCWIDFGTAAVQNACYPLGPGDWITVKLANLNEINANFEVGGECAFIAYEV